MSAKIKFYITEAHERTIKESQEPVSHHKFFSKFNRMVELGLVKKSISSYLDSSNDNVIIYNLMIATMFTDNDFTPPERSTNMEVWIDKMLKDNPDTNKIIFEFSYIEYYNEKYHNIMKNIMAKYPNIRWILFTCNAQIINIDPYNVFFWDDKPHSYCLPPENINFLRSLISTSQFKKQNRFFFLNHHPKLTRWRLVKFLFENGYDKLGKISFPDLNIFPINETAKMYNSDYEVEYMYNHPFSKNFPLLIDSMADDVVERADTDFMAMMFERSQKNQIYTLRQVGFHTSNLVLQISSYFEIFIETFFGTPDRTWISEKTWKPLATFTPFCGINGPDYYSFLKTQGFSFNSELYCDKYEEITGRVDPYVEKEFVLYSLMNHIKKLCDLSDEDIHGMYFSSIKEIISNTENYHYSFVPNLTLKPFEFIAK
jgi:hypothetical protein